MKKINLRRALDSLKITFTQLDWLRSFQLLTSKVSIKLFDPHLIPSYSQFGEDRIIENFFNGQDKGFYVDVGCNHPISFSNTWKLYLKGWRGIRIDPNPILIRQYKKIRPRDIAIQKAISRENTTIDFYFSKVSHLISGIGPKIDGHWKRTPKNSDVVRCASATLLDIFQEYDVSQQFDLLSIDVEGEELAVIDSMNIDTFTPTLIVVEIHDIDLSRPELDPIYLKLKSHGYYMISYLNPTSFFFLERRDG